MIVNTKQLINILQVKDTGLKTIKRRNQLEIRLKEKGYKLTRCVKKGRAIIYDIEKCKPVKIEKFTGSEYFKINKDKSNNKGIYKIQNGNKIYIGSTNSKTGFKNRFRQHYYSNRYTHDLLHDGGTFEILLDMTEIEDKELFRMVEKEFVDLYKKYTKFEVTNEREPYSYINKSEFKIIKIKTEDYEKVKNILELNYINYY